MNDGSSWPSLQAAVAASKASPVPKRASWSRPRAESSRQVVAARQADEILRHFQPTEGSEELRNGIIKYLQKVFERELQCKVIPVGSVPLKTYLPDSDIDLTLVTDRHPDDGFTSEVLSTLRREGENRRAEFEVRDVHFINAEVKLVKCLVQNILIDISFNQKGGLRALCFFELVDRLIGGDHIFKRSIIFIKAWCYYESRVLGAHHGLLSTYALEILILYIFNLFYKSLIDPLMVLYKFLDYFSEFDWDNNCISLNGPVSLSSLPQLVATGDGHDLLLSKEFLNSCMDMNSQMSKVPESSYLSFPKKYLNIIDPLKGSNNVGRSVGKGNFYRIRSAFAHGARKMGEAFKLPPVLMANEFNMFFKNTLDRHGSEQRPIVQDAFTFASSNAVSYNNISGKKENHRALNMHSGQPFGGSHKLLSKEKRTDKNFQYKREYWKENKLGAETSTEHKDADPRLKLVNMEAYNVAGKLSKSDAKELAIPRTTLSGSVTENHKGSISKSERGYLLANESNEPVVSTLSDLTGDLELHLRTLHEGYCEVDNKPEPFRKLLDTPQLRNIFSNTNLIIPTRELASSSSASGSHIAENMQKPHGKGTHFSTKKLSKPKNPVPATEFAKAASGASTRRSLYLPHRASKELSIKSQLNSLSSISIMQVNSPRANGLILQQRGQPEFGSSAALPLHAYSPEPMRRDNSSTTNNQGSRTRAVREPRYTTSLVP